MYRHWSVVFSFFAIASPKTLTLDLGHRVMAKWDEGPNLNPFYRNFTAMRFLPYNSAELHFQESRVVSNDSAFKNGYSLF